MWPNDSDGNAIRAGAGPVARAKAGYTVVDPGAYTDGTNDYTSQIAKFKAEDCEIFNTFPIPPDFATFWQQAAQQGYKPKIAQIAKTGLFPSQVEALGPIGVGLAERRLLDADLPLHVVADRRSPPRIWPTATRPRPASSGTSSSARASRCSTWRPRRFSAAADPKDKAAVAKAIGTLEVETPVGRLQWGKGPNANVVATPIIGGQWVAAAASTSWISSCARTLRTRTFPSRRS